jgi:hypothetical protein
MKVRWPPKVISGATSWWRAILCFAFVFEAIGCAHHSSIPSQPVSARPADYIDIQPRWRIVVITPVLRSGGFQVKTVPAQANGLAGQSGSSMELKVGPDFIGYETDYYSVNQTGKRMSIEFRSAKVATHGKLQKRTQPLLPLFHLPPETEYVRLIYLIRVSAADHDMAIVSAADLDTLNAVTELVRTDPSRCGGEHCSWVPSGIAVRAEARKNGRWEWPGTR